MASHEQSRKAHIPAGNDGGGGVDLPDRDHPAGRGVAQGRSRPAQAGPHPRAPAAGRLARRVRAQRAIARLESDAGYQGETWSITAADLGYGETVPQAAPRAPALKPSPRSRSQSSDCQAPATPTGAGSGSRPIIRAIPPRALDPRNTCSMISNHPQEETRNDPSGRTAQTRRI